MSTIHVGYIHPTAARKRLAQLIANDETHRHKPAITLPGRPRPQLPVLAPPRPRKDNGPLWVGVPQPRTAAATCDRRSAAQRRPKHLVARTISTDERALRSPGRARLPARRREPHCGRRDGDAPARSILT